MVSCLVYSTNQSLDRNNSYDRAFFRGFYVAFLANRTCQKGIGVFVICCGVIGNAQAKYLGLVEFWIGAGTLGLD